MPSSDVREPDTSSAPTTTVDTVLTMLAFVLGALGAIMLMLVAWSA